MKWLKRMKRAWRFYWNHKKAAKRKETEDICTLIEEWNIIQQRRKTHTRRERELVESKIKELIKVGKIKLNIPKEAQ